jgi:4-hydroxy-tetrahydrodipicolinate reductase
VSMEEIHHVHKLDSPSGTAITIAEGLIDELDSKASWTEDNSAPSNSEVNIISSREGEVPGTHVVHYNSEIDHIEIKHEAHNRKGFALGSVIAAEWIQGKKGVFTMKDLLNLN